MSQNIEIMKTSSMPTYFFCKIVTANIAQYINPFAKLAEKINTTMKKVKTNTLEHISLSADIKLCTLM
jgi:hypothetical protein